MLVPNPDVIAAALQAQTPHFAPIGWSHVGNDTTHHDVLDGLAVRTRHGRNLLTEEPASLVHLSLVSALSAAVFQFPRHQSNEHNLSCPILFIWCKGTINKVEALINHIKPFP
jgi:hypothetical protein